MFCQDVSVVFPYLCPSLPRPEKGETATGVDAICTYHPDPAGPVLDREQLYWELSHQTHGVTWLDPYILDRDHLYVNGEPLVVKMSYAAPVGFFRCCSEL